MLLCLWEGTRRWDTARIADLDWSKRHSIPCHVMFSNKAGEKKVGYEGDIRHLEWWCSSCQVTTRALLSWKWLNIYILMRNSEWISCFALIVCTTFALPRKTVFSSTCKFSHFYLSNSLSHPAVGRLRKQLCVLSHLMRLNHSIRDDRILECFLVDTSPDLLPGR